MRALVKEDIIIQITEKGNAEIGDYLPFGVGLERLRFDGKKIIDLIDLSEIWVRALSSTFFELHAIEVSNSQLVVMDYANRHNLIQINGQIRLRTLGELLQKEEDEENQLITSQQFQQRKKDDEWIQKFLKLTPDQLDTFVDNNMTDFASAKAIVKRILIILRRVTQKVERL